MAINLPNKGQLDARIGQVTVSLRDDMRAVSDLFETFSQLGAPALTTMGYTSDDINALLATFGALNELAKAYAGGNYAGPALPFDFQTATSAWWAAQ